MRYCPPHLKRPQTPAFLTCDQVADLLQVSVRKVYEDIRAGAIPKAELPGRTVRVPAKELYEQLAVSND